MMLVAYFSASGRTARLAQTIAQAAQADLYEIRPAQPYTSADLNWTDPDSRVVYEYENPEERDMELSPGTPADWDDYDVVFLGYPIWWGDAPRIISTFLESYDFDGRTIVPFCTSGSSGIGSSADDLQDLTNGASWLEGRRFSGGASQESIADWVDSLGLELSTAA